VASRERRRQAASAAAPARYSFSLAETVWGWVPAVWSETGLWQLGFPQSSRQAAAALIRAGTPEEIGPRAARLAEQLQSYFAGQKCAFDVALDWRGYPPFWEQVLRYITTIHCGATMSYGAVAAAVGRPSAARAVGGAMRANRIPIIVPCHRVIGADGSLTGFGGGLEVKEAMLRLEKRLAGSA